MKRVDKLNSADKEILALKELNNKTKAVHR